MVRLGAWWRAGRGRLVVIAPLAMTAGYAVVVASRLAELIEKLYWDSDAVSVPLLSEYLAHHLRGTTYTPIDSFVGWMLFDGLTAWIPGHRGFWVLAPLLLSVAACLLMAWAARRLFGSTAAVLSVCAGLCVPPIVFTTILPQGYHVSTWFCDALLGGMVCWAVTTTAGWTRLLAISVCVGVVIAVGYASDPFLLGTGIVPMLIAGAVAVALQRRAGAVRTAALVGTVLSVAFSGSLVAGRLARRAGIMRLNNIQPGLTTWHGLLKNVGFAWRNLNQMAGAPFYPGAAGEETLAPGLFHAVLVICALALPLFVGLRLHRSRPKTDLEIGRLIYFVFWVTSASAVLVAFVVTTLPADTVTGRYLVPAFYGVVALVAGASAVSRSSARMVAVLVVTFCASSIGQMATYPFAVDGRNKQVLAEVERRGLTRGYGGYYMANAVTWQSGGRVESRPVRQHCPGALDASLCPFTFNSNSDWYQARPQTRTFVVWSPSEIWVPLQPGPELGPPSEVVAVGDYRISIYPYDVATHFGPGAP